MSTLTVYTVTCCEDPCNPIVKVTTNYDDAYQVIVDNDYIAEYFAGERWWEIHTNEVEVPLTRVVTHVHTSDGYANEYYYDDPALLALV